MIPFIDLKAQQKQIRSKIDILIQNTSCAVLVELTHYY